MRTKTSSIQYLNADQKLNKPQQLLYFLLNWANNLFPYSNLDERLAIRDFTCQDLTEQWDRLKQKSSPSRRLCDLFWLKLPWAQIKEELHQIKILDTGCGKGNYANLLMDYSQNQITRYTGIDTYQDNHWMELTRQGPFYFCQFDGADIRQTIPEGTNFFMSQSAIEHIEEDLAYFQQIKDYIASYQESVIQIHLFPSSSCLPLYALHGIRQYTPRTVSKITRLFKNSSLSVLFRLGGRACNRLHYQFITEPFFTKRTDFRESKTEEYERRLRLAIEQDMKSPQRAPAFYALVFCSHWRGRNICDTIAGSG